MFQGLEHIPVQDDAIATDRLRRVGWPELAAAISLSRDLRHGADGLRARAGPFSDRGEVKDERAVNPSSLVRRKAPDGSATPSAQLPPRRDRENR